MRKSKAPAKSSLKPGMLVRNAHTGTTGILRADPRRPDKLKPSARDRVAVHADTGWGPMGENRTWSLCNVVVLK